MGRGDGQTVGPGYFFGSGRRVARSNNATSARQAEIETRLRHLESAEFRFSVADPGDISDPPSVARPSQALSWASDGWPIQASPSHQDPFLLSLLDACAAAAPAEWGQLDEFMIPIRKLASWNGGSGTRDERSDKRMVGLTRWAAYVALREYDGSVSQSASFASLPYLSTRLEMRSVKRLRDNMAGGLCREASDLCMAGLAQALISPEWYLKAGPHQKWSCVATLNDAAVLLNASFKRKMESTKQTDVAQRWIRERALAIRRELFEQLPDVSIAAPVVCA